MRLHIRALVCGIAALLAMPSFMVAQPEPSGSINQHLSFALEAAQREDTAQIAALGALLTHPDDRVRRYSAFALGQIGSVAGSIPLLNAWHREKSEDVRSAMVEALGRCGDSQTLASLIEQAGRGSPADGAALAFSIVRFAIRGIKDTNTAPILDTLLRYRASRAAAVYALVRSVQAGYIRRHVQSYVELLSDSSSEVRMWTATLFGSGGDSTSRDVLLYAALQDPDWRVRVNATRALCLYESQQTTHAMLRLLHDSCEHVSLAAFGVLKLWERIDTVLLNECEKIFEDSAEFSWRQRGEAAFILAEKSDRSIAAVCAALPTAISPFQVRILRALGERPAPGSRTAVAGMLAAHNPAVRAEAIGAYRKILRHGRTEEKIEFCQKLVLLTGKKDPAVIVAIAEALQDTLLPPAARCNACIRLIPLYKELDGSDFVEAKEELSTAFKLFGEVAELREVLQSYPLQSAKAARRPMAEEELQILQRFHGAIVTTTRGGIRIQFQSEAAPFTVLNFIRLTQRSFYDGTVFHRVVPNFVIQGGDPLGTGFGGPGYAINTEIHPDAKFTTGAVGMANAGKDTEGSQFFITHCATPNLNGNYTVFGKTEDRIVVDAVQEGDSILSVRLLSE
jgi:cyclophilin family peptidyl-prolyl cis-trans isomerase/HEAT repeat protein